MTKTIRIRKFIAAVALAAGAGLALAGPASADEGGLAYYTSTFEDFDPSRYDYESLVKAGCVDAYGNIDQWCAERHGVEVEEESSTPSVTVPAEGGGGLDQYRWVGSVAGSASSAGSGVNLSSVARDARLVLDWVL